MNRGVRSYLALLIFSGIHLGALSAPLNELTSRRKNQYGALRSFHARTFHDNQPLVIFIVSSDSDEPQRLPTCVYYHSNAARLSVLQGDEEPHAQLSSVTDDQGRQVNITTCRKSTDFCYTFWKDDGDNHTSTVISQGCWESSRRVDCNRSECLSTSRSSKVLFQSRFCCCSGYLCNLRMAVDSAVDTEFIGSAVQTHDSLSQTVTSAASQGTPVEVIVIVVISVTIVVALVVTAVFVFQTCIRAKLIKASTVSARNSGENQSQPLIGGQWLNSLKLIEIIGQGRYGTVWKASMADSYVAVKVFNAASRCYYYNEREVYSLPFLEHPNIIKYLGSEEVSPLDGLTEYRLILEYAPLGCLQDHLRHNSVDWSTLCKMGRSIARGLSHLHTDFPRGDRMKLCIAHRDLNSRNVLVKADLTCCICDLGFAMQMSGAHYYYNGEEQHAETTSLCDVGTLRYMSPEVLEGAVNLRECEASLKQIDVYSLGLVLWEIAYRCQDLYPTKEAPQYLLPFEEETGPHPTLEQMKTLVCRHKARPILPDSWRDHCASVRLLKATLEDAWDQDAEARLTSLCVEERWAELPVLWERERHKGFSPTLYTNPCNLVHPDHDHGPSSPQLHPLSSHPHLRVDSNTLRDDTLSKLVHGCSSSTIETAAGTNFKNSVGAWPPSPRPLQPHQGRNPCMERNTCTQSDEFSVSGNALVDRSTKHLRTDITTPARFDAASFDVPSSSSGYLNYSRVVNPIPYVQNAVRDTGSTRTASNGANVTEEPTHGIGKFFSGIFRLNRNKRNSPVSPDTECWEEHERLCPTLSSPSDIENPNAPVTTVIKTNNQFVVPKATEVRWEEQGLPSVSLIKSTNTNIAVENVQATVCNVAFNESALGSGAKAGMGVGKLHQTSLNAQDTAYSPKGTRRQETKSTAINGCDKPSVGADVTSSEFPNPKPLSTRAAPTTP